MSMETHKNAAKHLAHSPGGDLGARVGHEVHRGVALGAGVAVRLGLLTPTVPRRQHKLQREGWAHKGRGSSVDTSSVDT
jgi:hypothetical protein